MFLYCFLTSSREGFLDQLSGRPQAQQEQVRNLGFSVHPSTFSGKTTLMHSHFLYAGAASSIEDAAKSNVHVRAHTHTYTHGHRYRYTWTHTHIYTQAQIHRDTDKYTHRHT